MSILMYPVGLATFGSYSSMWNSPRFVWYAVQSSGTVLAHPVTVACVDAHGSCASTSALLPNITATATTIATAITTPTVFIQGPSLAAGIATFEPQTLSELTSEGRRDSHPCGRAATTAVRVYVQRSVSYKPMPVCGSNVKCNIGLTSDN